MAAVPGHKAAPEGTECMVCYDDISPENYVEFRAVAGGEWLPSKFCQACIGELQGRQYKDWVNCLTTTDCEATLRRMLRTGPPIYLKGLDGVLPALKAVGADGKEIPEVPVVDAVELWFASDNSVTSAKLNGAPEGDERLAFWEHHKSLRPEIMAQIAEGKL